MSYCTNVVDDVDGVVLLLLLSLLVTSLLLRRFLSVVVILEGTVVLYVLWILRPGVVTTVAFGGTIR